MTIEVSVVRYRPDFRELSEKGSEKPWFGGDGSFDFWPELLGFLRSDTITEGFANPLVAVLPPSGVVSEGLISTAVL